MVSLIHVDYSNLCRELRKADQILEKEISIMEKSLYQLRIDLENLKSIQEEKEESLRVAARAVLEEDKKLAVEKLVRK